MRKKDNERIYHPISVTLPDDSHLCFNLIAEKALNNQYKTVVEPHCPWKQWKVPKG